MSLLLLRSQGGSLFPGIIRIAASVTPEAAEAAEARANEAAELAEAALKGNEAPSLLPPLKSAAAVAASKLNASPLLSRVSVAVPMGSTDLLVFVHKAKAALVYKTLLSQGRTIASVTVRAVKDSICTAALSSFELSLFSSAAFARAAAAAGWRALNPSTFLSVDPFSSPSSSGDCVVARVLDEGAAAAAPDALLVRCRVSASRLRRPSFLDGGGGNGEGGSKGEGEIDLSKISASVRGKVACVLPTLEEVLLVDAVPRAEGDGALVSAWEEAVGGSGGSSTSPSSSSSSFASSPFWLRAIPRIEVEDDCGDGEDLSFATSEKGKREGKLVPPSALLAAPALGSLPLAGGSGGGGSSNFLLGAFLSALTSPVFSDLWGGRPLAVEGTARLVPRPPAPLFGRPSFGAGAAAKGAESSFAASFSWASSSSAAAVAASAAAAPAASAAAAAPASSVFFPVDLNDYKISPLPFDVPAEAADPSTLLSAAASAAAAGEDAGGPSSEAATRARPKRRPAVEPSLALRSALAAAAEAATAATAEAKQRRELQQQHRPSKAAAAAMAATTQASMPAKKKLGPMRLPISSDLAAFRRKGVTLVGVRAGEFGGGMFAGGMSKKKKKGGAGGAGAGAAAGGAGGGKASAATKRKPPAAAAAAAAAGDGGESSNAPAKKAKKAAAVEDPAAVAAAVAKVRAAFAAGEQAKLTNDELKAFLKSVGKTVGGNKAALIERALGAIGSGGGAGGGGGGGAGGAAAAAGNNSEPPAAAPAAPAAPDEPAAAVAPAAAAPGAAAVETLAPAPEVAKPGTAPPPPSQPAALSPVAEH